MKLYLAQIDFCGDWMVDFIVASSTEDATIKAIQLMPEDHPPDSISIRELNEVQNYRIKLEQINP